MIKMFVYFYSARIIGAFWEFVVKATKNSMPEQQKACY